MDLMADDKIDVSEGLTCERVDGSVRVPMVEESNKSDL